MQIFVKGQSGRSVALDVLHEDTVQDVLAQMVEQESLAPANYRLVFGRSSLCNNQTMAECDLHSGSTAYLTLGLRGGGDDDDEEEAGGFGDDDDEDDEDGGERLPLRVAAVVSFCREFCGVVQSMWVH